MTQNQLRSLGEALDACYERSRTSGTVGSYILFCWVQVLWHDQ